MIRTFQASLLAASALVAAAPAHAQQSDEIIAELRALRAEVGALRDRVVELETSQAAAMQTPQVQLATMTTVQPQPAPPPQPAPGPQIAFHGAPQITAPGGWSFKPRGRLQYDFASVSSPRGISNPGLGFSNELRRARLGVEGTMPGGFGYTFELDFADNNVDITDAFLNYRASPELVLTVGQHNNFQSLEELTSSRFSSFIERAAFTDAFNFERRVGLSGTFASGDVMVQAGLFTDNVTDLRSDANNAAGADARIVYAPELGDTRLHLGASAHWRDTGDVAGIGTRYRQRPLVHSTDVRFIGTPALTVENETDFGLEAALIHGPFYAASEAHWFEADSLLPGVSPNFFGAYADIGWFITGETRGYRGGRWDRTRVLHPVGGGEGGGAGAFQVNLRYDYLDLNSGAVRGGMQNGLQASLIWIPQDYVRFMLNYGHMIYDDAIIPAAGGDRDYGVDVIGARAQVDF
jgi:phosphate-selective porin OprO and OprP